MAIRVGILGVGFMGKMHVDTYAKVKGAKVTAICDIDEQKRQGHIGFFMGDMDVSGLTIYRQAKALFADPALDVIDICLPTYLHAKYTVMALEAGKHVICEKPMARTSAEAKTMIKAAKKSGKKLFIGQCIRFWPTYAKAKALVDGGKYGKVVSARFCRLSPKPFWSWNNWLHQPAKSGLCALDLHIHDSDYVQFLFGKPKAVLSHGLGRKGKLDHIITEYKYGADQLITAEGGWEYSATYPFGMSFVIHMEKATLVMDTSLKLTLHPVQGKEREVNVRAGDGYEAELKHFIACLRQDQDSDIVTPESAMHSVKLVELELDSAAAGKAVPVRF